MKLNRPAWLLIAVVLVASGGVITSALGQQSQLERKQPNNAFYYGFSSGAAPQKQDPEMAALVQSDFDLAQQSDVALARYSEADDDAERDGIKVELKELLTKQFDVQRQRRQLELARVEERIQRLRGLFKKRDDAREKIIQERLEQLVREADGLGWSAPAGHAPSSGFTGRIQSR